jgi:hypothetical protein
VHVWELACSTCRSYAWSCCFVLVAFSIDILSSPTTTGTEIRRVARLHPINEDGIGLSTEAVRNARLNFFHKYG